MFFKLVIFFFLLLFLQVLGISTSYAAENFKTDYLINYTLSNTVNTRADMAITLTNTTTEYYASSYKIQLGFTDVRNLKVLEDKVPADFKITKNDRGTL